DITNLRWAVVIISALSTIRGSRSWRVWRCWPGAAAMGLKIAEHLHEIEYHRQYDRDRREHLYTERVDDQGFVLVHDPAKLQQWLVRYSQPCWPTTSLRWLAMSPSWPAMPPCWPPPPLS